MATDRRTKYTKTVIRQALFDLLQEKPINKITVTDVCKLADINRSTFYSHYEDVYALLASIQNELFENVVLTLTTENWFEEVLQLVDQNKEILEKDVSQRLPGDAGLCLRLCLQRCHRHSGKLGLQRIQAGH